jgi:hypothetical protein
MRIVSVPGRRIVDPISRRVVDEAGLEVSEFDPFWTHLIEDGDVAILPEASAAPAEGASSTDDPSDDTKE